MLLGIIVLIASLGFGMMRPVARTAAAASGRSPRNVAPANAQVTPAKGQAGSNRLIAQSLSDPVLQHQLINKLRDKINGMLVPSGNGFILDLKSFTNQTTPSPSPSTAS